MTVVWHEAIVLGAGPTGISCALQLHEERIDCLVIDQKPRMGGRLTDIENTIRNFAARFWQNGSALRDDLEDLCQRVNLPVQLAEPILKVDLQSKTLYSEQTVYQYQTLFLATGARTRTLPISNADAFQHHIFYGSEKFEQLLRGKPVAIVGGGDNALMESAWLAERCPSVLVFNRSGQFRARPDVLQAAQQHPHIKLFPHTEVISVQGEAADMQSVQVRNRQSAKTSTHAACNLVIRIGVMANAELFHGQLEFDRFGFIKTAPTCQTTVNSVYAGGDLISPHCHLIARGVGDGVIAAHSMIQEVRANQRDNRTYLM